MSARPGPPGGPSPPEIRRDSPLPLYHQLKLILVGRIERGEYREGDLIPGEQELQDRFGLSRTTVRQALREMEIEGLVTRHRGRGTFVAPPPSGGPEFSAGPHAVVPPPRPIPEWRVLSAALAPASGEIARAFGVAAGTPLFRVERLRLAGEVVVGHTVSHVSSAIRGPFDREKLASGDAVDYLRALRVLEDATAERVIEAVAASADEADLLDVPPGAPLLRVTRTICDREGALVELFHAFFCGDRYQLKIAGLSV